MRQILCFLLIGLVACTGCKKEPPPPPPQAAPPPPTPEQIYGEIRPTVEPLLSAMTNGLPDTTRDKVVSDLRGMKGKHSGVENGRIALGRISVEIEELIRKARDENRWPIVIGGIMACDVLKPGSMGPDGRYASLLKRAELMVARPKVEVTGFVTMDTQLYTFLRVTDKATKKIETFKIREGEEFFEPIDPKTNEKKSAILRLIRVVGNQQAVELLYIPANDTWEIPGPSAS